MDRAREEEDEVEVDILDGEAAGVVDGEAHCGGGSGVAKGQEDGRARRCGPDSTGGRSGGLG